MGDHLIDGEFQSDKYPTTPRGKVPLSVKDRSAQDLLWTYAQRRRAVDAAFADDLEAALRIAGYVPPAASTPPNAPYQLEESRTASNNGGFHLYLIGADGRKMAALWGTAADKISLGSFIVEAAEKVLALNPHPKADT